MFSGELRCVVGLIIVLLTSCQARDRAADVSSRQPALPPSPSTLPVTIENRELGAFAIRAAKPVRLAVVARIQSRQPDGTWADLPPTDNGAGYRLRTNCEELSGTCRDLSPGDTVEPVPWLGNLCAGQCRRECTQDSFFGGAQRLVLQGCDDPTQLAVGPTFEFPPRAHMLPRWRAVNDVVSGSVQRVHSSDTPDPGGLLFDQYVAARTAPRPLSRESIDTLVHLMRSPDGFLDSVVQRCKPGISLAFSLQRAWPATPALAPKNTIVIDLECLTLTVAGDRSTESVRTSFDPQRAAFIALAKQALPDDPDLRQLGGQAHR